MKKILLCSLLITITFCRLSAQNSCGLQITGAVTNVRCFGEANGAIDATVTGGSGSYNWWWASGTEVWHTLDINNLAPGTYTLYITDANNPNCSANQSFDVTEPDPLELTWLSNTTYNGADLHCYNSNDGQISVFAAGGTAPYQYSLDGTNFQSSNIFSNLPAGTYYGTVKDNNGCAVTNDPSSSYPKPIGWLIPAVTLDAPAPLVTDSIQVTPSTVLSTGAATYTIYLGYAVQSLGLSTGNTTGGTGMYTYEWTPTTGLASWDAASVLASPTTTTTYTVTITDVNGCSVQRSVTINVVSVTSGSGSSKKATLCHNGKTISVSINSVSQHLAHGDNLGPCATGSVNKAKRVVEESNEDAQVVIAPNPSRGRFTIDLSGLKGEKGQIEIFNAAGLSVQRTTIAAGQAQQSFNLAGRAPGVYFIRISTGAGSTISRIILQ